jgi:hypothetical protein
MTLQYREFLTGFHKRKKEESKKTRRGPKQGMSEGATGGKYIILASAIFTANMASI